MKKLIPLLLLLFLFSCKKDDIYLYTIQLNYRDCSCPPDTITVYGNELSTSYYDLILDKNKIGMDLRSYEVLSKEKK